ncbi:Insulin-like prepropeptide ILP1 [Paramuricea clavata]|uniref:Insulin-like prepropeptide ILP1 n=1 Tax=Paramuricea clavata TaxID=317549 RepID=A0A7D9LFT3_PARCT|nr:Insulin-like prepropeptide ILP1 [Paramuricea clavata]
MALNTVIAFTTILLSIFVVTIFASEQNKPGQLYKLCGNDFIAAYQDCCDYGYPACASMASSDGNIEALEPVPDPCEGKLKALERRGKRHVIMMPSRVAKHFLGSRWKRDLGHTAVMEECCNEGCSYKEIAEYPCFS